MSRAQEGQRPTVALAMIVKDEEQRLPPLLESIRPAEFDQFIVVDTGSTDGTKAVLEEESNLRVALGQTPIEVYDFTWVNDFAAARNFSFSKVTTDWQVWLDSDDTLEGGELLHGLVAEQDEEVGGIWIPYFYAFDEYGNCTTLLDRERIFRTKFGWEWIGAIHETARATQAIRLARTTEIKVKHRSGYEEYRGPRNLAIILATLEKNPEDLRNWLYLAHQYFAMQDWNRAIEWYTKFFVAPNASEIERWQATVYAAKCMAELEEYHEALRLGFRAIMLQPQYADGYIEVASAYLKLDDWERAIEHAEVAKHKSPPERIIFINQLEYAYRPHAILNVAYWHAGMLEQALAEARQALVMRPAEESLLSNIKLFQDAITLSKATGAFATMADGLNDKKILKLTDFLGDIKRDPRARDVWVPAQLRVTQKGTQPRMDIFCGRTLEPWTPDIIAEGGMGGSETAVVEISKRLQKAGWQVTIYAEPNDHEGWYEGVGYLGWKRFNPHTPKDTVVSWRNPGLGLEPIVARQKWLWMHDLNKGPDFTAAMGRGFDKVFGVSQWHASYLERVYPFLKGKTGYLYNGVVDVGFEPARKQHGKAIYSSSPDRGLLPLLTMWPSIIAREPSAELHIFYGWNTFEATITKGINPTLAALKDQIEYKLQQPGVFWRGRVPQKELHQEMATADLWLYPTAFLEVFCITAVEAMKSGLIPVTSRLGALPEVIGEAGLLVPGHVQMASYWQLWLGCALAALSDGETRQTYHSRGKAQATPFTWDNAAAQWLEQLKEGV